ncbi:nuclear transport factor 2 family protein [Pedobacter rhodius]|uniref:Nuclear transport factor 2 family protein n=1 Tax=Pedobacter rhodius TaxID=3004098 RepID=A0ABT4KVA7_9SPHI|nr:nuclear transport factor 2 family protein [Pedobacter sp. SJ11]MCZ4222855.1 nuclear transport factor 2 family protein [Pedobacter sp. SJ11]
MKSTEKQLAEHNSKVVVTDFLTALNKEDFETARAQLADNVTFKGAMGERNGADVYIEDMKTMKFKYDVKKIFADENDVCIWYDINMDGKTFFSAGWYKLEEEKIKSFQVIFDPRPIL